MNLTIKVLIALGLGAIVGITLHYLSPNLFATLDNYLFGPLGEIFLNLVQMIIIPLIFFSLVLGVSSLGDPKKLGRIGIKTVTFFLVTTIFAITVGISLASIFRPGNVDVDTSKLSFSGETTNLKSNFLDLIPSNPIQAMAEGNILQVLIFSIFIGLAVALLGKKVEGLRNLMEQGNEIVMTLVNLIMRFAPYGAFGLLASSIGQMGLDGAGAMIFYMLVVILGLLLHAIVFYGAIIYFLGRMNPIKFYKDFLPAILIGFSTVSSVAALPVSLKMTEEKMGIPKQIGSFVQTLGATINMDGTAIMQGTATLFIAQVYGSNLTFFQLTMIVIVAVLASIGTTSVPYSGLIMLTMILSQVSLPVEGIALIIGIDRLLDMMRVSVNISGDAVCALVVSESEKRRQFKKTAQEREQIKLEGVKE
ncbi:dicarboxylate/amino acid:cation symporter [Oceanobacillus locisalsi]|uniref:Dicarboxylate/amino acid:cation symporter n=1 Tax=Oceanobacillus locisalsi TaxID=546107 RepID=A0ABW3NK25_9BACI